MVLEAAIDRTVVIGVVGIEILAASGYWAIITNQALHYTFYIVFTMAHEVGTILVSSYRWVYKG